MALGLRVGREDSYLRAVLEVDEGGSCCISAEVASPSEGPHGLPQVAESG